MVETNGKKKFTSMQITAISFLILIICGAVLLSLPVCNKKPIEFIDAMFLSVSSVCVTGLTPIVPIEQFNFWGQLIIAILIQIGGLGFMAFVTLIFIFLKKRITLKERILLGDSFGSNALQGLVKLTRRILLYTFIVEMLGAIIIATRTVPLYGLAEGSWKAIFLSVSSFCNAGFDLFGGNSLISFATDKIICSVSMILTLFGGIGFLVWNEVREKIGYKIKNKISFRKMISLYSVHTKMVFAITAILLVVGTVLLLITEYRNEETIADFNFGDKVFVSLFQSVNARTTGITSVPTAKLTNASKIITCMLMFIGGAPGSTAGGIKIVTFGLLFMTALSVILDRKHVNIFKREIPEELIKKAVTLVSLAITLVVFATIILTVTEPGKDVIDIALEAISGFATCGLSASITPTLSGIGKIIIMLLMYCGRITTITMTMAIFKGNMKEHDIIRYSSEEVIVG